MLDCAAAKVVAVQDPSVEDDCAADVPVQTEIDRVLQIASPPDLGKGRSLGVMNEHGGNA